ncbi:MAG TPA: ATP-binding protein [Pyrinomonadaceae bacterium]|jgi:signal transduction histidine kinase
MRPLKLHTKTTLLASAITVAVLAAALAYTTARVADIVRDEQKARAELQALSFAEQISAMPAPRDPQTLAQAAALVRGARPGVVAVRVWARVGGVFEPTATAGDAGPADIPEEIKTALRNGQAARAVAARPAGASASLYRVFAPVKEGARFSGAVELVEQLEDAPTIARSYERTAALMALLAVALITLGTYLLFRQLVYRPVERLLAAMARAEGGDLNVSAPARAPDELGLLSRGFNRMIGRLRAAADERDAQRRVLQERVREATTELQQRYEQVEAQKLELEEQNVELLRMRQLSSQLERLAAAGQTAAQFAHEVGTPLNLISGHVQLLSAQLGADERAAARLATISAQIERIERIVRRMLDRTRPGPAARAPVELNALLARVFDAVAPALDARGVRLRTDLAEPLPTIAGDADRLQQVCLNLVNNALDAMPGGGELRVRTYAADANGNGATARRVVVEFADTGSGMTAEVRAHIFDPLYTTKARGRGTGLGLVVVRQLVREHDGEIEVESERGRGSCFRLSFPAADERAAKPAAPAVAARRDD